MAQYTLLQMRSQLALKLKDPWLLDAINNHPDILDMNLNLSANKVSTLTNYKFTINTTLDALASQQEYDTKDLGGTDTFVVDSVIGVDYYINSKWNILEDTSIDRLNLDYPDWRNTAAGTPSKWYYDGVSKIGLYAKPLTAGTDIIKLSYYSREIVLTAGTSVCTCPPEYMIELIQHAWANMTNNIQLMNAIEQKLDTWGRVKEMRRANQNLIISEDVYSRSYDGGTE